MLHPSKWKLFLGLVMGALLYPFAISARPCDRLTSYIDLDTGYRWDKAQAVLDVFGPAIAGATQETAKGVNSWQLGAKGRAYFCDYFFVKGAGHYGWVFSGSYDSSNLTGNLDDSHTWDVTGGVGYLFFMHPCWGFAPSVGWSYDLLDFKSNNTSIPIAGVAVPGGDIEFRSRFSGPWVGFEVQFVPLCAFDLSLKYELHHAHWHSRHSTTLESAAIGLTRGFASRSDHNNIWGHLFEIDTNYYFCCCWNVGIDLKYQIWKSQGKGHFHRDTPINAVINKSLVDDVEWESFSLMLHLGYAF